MGWDMASDLRQLGKKLRGIADCGDDTRAKRRCDWAKTLFLNTSTIVPCISKLDSREAEGVKREASFRLQDLEALRAGWYQLGT